MTDRHLLSLALLVVGTSALLLSVLALLVLPAPFVRLHALSCATSLGAPLVTLALAVESGPGRAALKLLFIGVALATGGSVTTIALGQVTYQTEPHGREPAR